jgi:hypothetical protein
MQDDATPPARAIEVWEYHLNTAATKGPWKVGSSTEASASVDVRSFHCKNIQSMCRNCGKKIYKIEKGQGRKINANVLA